MLTRKLHLQNQTTLLAVIFMMMVIFSCRGIRNAWHTLMQVTSVHLVTMCKMLFCCCCNDTVYSSLRYSPETTICAYLQATELRLSVNDLENYKHYCYLCQCSRKIKKLHFKNWQFFYNIIFITKN